MTVSIVNVDWPQSARIVPSRYPPIGLFDRVANQADLEAVFEIEGLTNDRIRDQLGEIHLVPEEDRVYGEGTTPIMAAFTHPNSEGSRFSNGSYGVYYAGRDIDTAIAEARYHRERFLRYSLEPPIRLEMRTYYAEIDSELHDLRNLRHSQPEIFNPGPNSYSESQRLGLELRASGSNGVIYQSVRQPEGECVGIFRPPAISPIIQGPHFQFIWDGTSISDVLYVQSYSE